MAIRPRQSPANSPRLLPAGIRGHNAHNQHYVKYGLIGFRYGFRRFTGFSYHFDMGGRGYGWLVIFAGASNPQKKAK